MASMGSQLALKAEHRPTMALITLVTYMGFLLAEQSLSASAANLGLASRMVRQISRILGSNCRQKNKEMREEEISCSRQSR